jgi:hypothetical protein
MYSRYAGVVFGFHGCDKSIAEQVINLKQPLKQSNNDYDWLGNGMYFWENSPVRALDYAIHLKENPHKSKNPIKEPAVIGAVLQLGHCFDLLDFENLAFLKSGYYILEETNAKAKQPLPRNKKIGDLGELMLRELDCAVIETIHKVRQEENLNSFDSVRGVFWEGKELYPNAGFREKDHIQICIRNPNCIKGFFLPREVDDNYPLV